MPFSPRLIDFEENVIYYTEPAATLAEPFICGKIYLWCPKQLHLMNVND